MVGLDDSPPTDAHRFGGLRSGPRRRQGLSSEALGSGPTDDHTAREQESALASGADPTRALGYPSTSELRKRCSVADHTEFVTVRRSPKSNRRDPCHAARAPSIAGRPRLGRRLHQLHPHRGGEGGHRAPRGGAVRRRHHGPFPCRRQGRHRHLPPGDRPAPHPRPAGRAGDARGDPRRLGPPAPAQPCSSRWWCSSWAAPCDEPPHGGSHHRRGRRKAVWGALMVTAGAALLIGALGSIPLWLS